MITIVPIALAAVILGIVLFWALGRGCRGQPLWPMVLAFTILSGFIGLMLSIAAMFLHGVCGVHCVPL